MQLKDFEKPNLVLPPIENLKEIAQLCKILLGWCNETIYKCLWVGMARVAMDITVILPILLRFPFILDK